MKIAFYTVFFFALGLYAFFYKLPSVCDSPLKYRIGTIDRGFNIPQDELLTSVLRAEQIWENASGRDLFIYVADDPNALVINMSYDKRQESTQAIDVNKNRLNDKKNELDPKILEYERRTAAFKQRAAQFGATVSSYNSQGGAPEGVFEKLLDEQKYLEREADELNALANSLNQSAADYNQTISQLNISITEFNTITQSKPEEGLYDPNLNAITIYYHITQDELVHTLAHELGHYRGLNHRAELDAIMYERVNKTLIPTQSDLSALNAICTQETTVSRLQKTDWKRFGQFYAQQFAQFAAQ